MRNFLIHANDANRMFFIAVVFLVFGLLGLAVAVFVPAFGLPVAAVGLVTAIAYATGGVVLRWWKP